MNLSSQPLDDAHALKCELAAESLRSSGTLRLQVTGWSMLPSVWPGDTLVVESVDRNAVSEGDIVLFGRDRRLFAHRVVTNASAPGDGIVTWGDAMPAPDSPVSDDGTAGQGLPHRAEWEMHRAQPESAHFRTRRRSFGSQFGHRRPCGGGCARHASEFTGSVFIGLASSV